MDREELAWDIKVACFGIVRGNGDILGHLPGIRVACFEILIEHEKRMKSRSKCEDITVAFWYMFGTANKQF